jgi:hypothetical protein
LPHATLTFCSLFAGRCWCLCPGWHSGHLNVHHQWEHSFLCARSSPKVPTTLMGTLLTRLTRFSVAQLRPTLRSTTGGARCRDLESSHCLMRHSRFARCLQGGGVYVQGGTVAISWCTISGNTAYDTVRAHLRKFPHTTGKIADALDSTLVCTCARLACALWSTTDCTCYRDLIPMALMGCLAFVTSFVPSRSPLPSGAKYLCH